MTYTIEEIKAEIKNCQKEIAAHESQLGQAPVEAEFNSFFTDEVVEDDAYRMERIAFHARRLQDWMKAEVAK